MKATSHGPSPEKRVNWKSAMAEVRACSAEVSKRLDAYDHQLETKRRDALSIGDYALYAELCGQLNVVPENQEAYDRGFEANKAVLESITDKEIRAALRRDIQRFNKMFKEIEKEHL